MERLNKKTLSFPAMSFTRAFAALGMVLALAACGKGGGGGGNNGNVGWNCANGSCGGISNPSLLATFSGSSSTGAFQLQNMQLLAQAGVSNIPASEYYKSYSGPVALGQGQLVVPQQFFDTGSGFGWYNGTGCVVPAGTYNVQNRNAGSLGIYGQDLQLDLITTSHNIVIRIEAPASLGMGLMTGGTKLYGAVKILSVNGMACSQTFYDTVN